MATMIAFSLLMAFLFGGMMLALVMGYVESEKARSAKDQQDRSVLVQAVQDAPHFFAEPRTASPRANKSNGILDDLEGYMKAEQALVARFVNDPSLDNLYHPAHVSLSIN